VKTATVFAMLAGNGIIPDPSDTTYAMADYSGRCEQPIVIDRIGVGHALLDKPVHTDADTPEAFVYERGRTLSMQVRCRKCGACMRERRRMWTERAAREWRQSTRTWFITLTLRPEEHYLLQTRVRVRLQEAGVDFDRMEPRDRLAEVLKDYRHRMSQYVNRLRVGLRLKGWKTVSFRYLWVPEPHKSGAIHFHMLLHEVSEDQQVVAARIKAAWPFGFTTCKLVESENAARYVTKYLGKHHFEGRLNASLHYGERELEPAVQLAAAPFPGHVGGRPDQVLPTPEQERQAQLEMGAIPGQPDEDEEDVSEVHEGDDLGVCPTGQHLGVQCNCQVTADAGGDPWGTERPEAHDPRGMAKRKWQLRGWHQPNDHRGGSVKKPRDSVH